MDLRTLAVRPDGVDPDHVGVAQAGRGLGLALESRAAGAVGGGEDLDGDQAEVDTQRALWARARIFSNYYLEF